MQAGVSEFKTAREAMASPLAKRLFGIDGVASLFFGSDFVTVRAAKSRLVEPANVCIVADGCIQLLNLTQCRAPAPQVTKSDEYPWSVLKPDVFAAIMDHYTSGAGRQMNVSNASQGIGRLGMALKAPAQWVPVLTLGNLGVAQASRSFQTPRAWPRTQPSMMMTVRCVCVFFCALTPALARMESRWHAVIRAAS